MIFRIAVLKFLSGDRIEISNVVSLNLLSLSILMQILDSKFSLFGMSVSVKTVKNGQIRVPKFNMSRVWLGF